MCRLSHDSYLEQTFRRIHSHNNCRWLLFGADILEDHWRTLTTSSCHLTNLIWIRPQWRTNSHSTYKFSNYFYLKQALLRILDELSQQVHVIYRIWSGSDLNGRSTLTTRASCRMTSIWSRPSWGSAWGSPSPCIQRIQDTCPLSALPHRWQTNWLTPSFAVSFPWKIVSAGSVRESRRGAHRRGGWCQPMSQWTCCPLLWREIARLEMKIESYELDYANL